MFAFIEWIALQKAISEEESRTFSFVALACAFYTGRPMSFLSKAMSLLVETPPQSNPASTLRPEEAATDDLPFTSDARLPYEKDAPRGEVRSVADIAREQDSTLR